MYNIFKTEFEQNFEDYAELFQNLSFEMADKVYGYKVGNRFQTIAEDDYLTLLNKENYEELRRLDEISANIRYDYHNQNLINREKEKIKRKIKKIGDFGNSFTCPYTRKQIKERELINLKQAYEVFIAIADILKIKNDDLQDFKRNNHFLYEQMKKNGYNKIKNFYFMDYDNREFLEEKIGFTYAISNSLKKEIENKGKPINYYKDSLDRELALAMELSLQDEETKRIYEQEEQLHLDRAVGLSLQDQDLTEEDIEKQIEEDFRLAVKLQNEEIRKHKNNFKKREYRYT